MAKHEFLLVCISSACWFLAIAGFVGQALPLWDGVIRRRCADRVDRCDDLLINSQVIRWVLRIWSIVLILGAIAVWKTLDGVPPAIVYAALMFLAPVHLLDAILSRRVLLIEAQLVKAANTVANGLQAGLSIPQCFAAVGQEADAPTSHLFMRIAQHYAHGRPLVDALQETRQRLGIEAFTLFALAIEVATERGGPLNVVLQRLAANLREWHRLKRKIHADTAAGRQVVRILGAFPAVFIAMFYWFAPELVGTLFNTVAGHLTLCVVVLLTYVGVRWATRMISLNVT